MVYLVCIYPSKWHTSWVSEAFEKRGDDLNGEVSHT